MSKGGKRDWAREVGRKLLVKHQRSVKSGKISDLGGNERVTEVR